MVISLIHPSRGRAEKSFETANKWIDKAGVDVEYILSIDDDDSDVNNYKNTIGKTIISKNRSAVDAINNAAKVSKGDILVVMSDDFLCPNDWAKKLIERTEGKSDWIIKTIDGTQKWIITLPIMDRIYYNRFGYIYNPEYLHMFCDTDLTCVADLLGRKLDWNIEFTHNHYSTGKSKRDHVSVRADKTWAQGEATFIKRSRENFGVSNPVGEIQDKGYANWIKQRI